MSVDAQETPENGFVIRGFESRVSEINPGSRFASDSSFGISLFFFRFRDVVSIYMKLPVKTRENHWSL